MTHKSSMFWKRLVWGLLLTYVTGIVFYLVAWMVLNLIGRS